MNLIRIMELKYPLVWFTFVAACKLVLLEQVAGRSTFYSYETKTNSIDDGNKVITRFEERNFDSMSPESIKQKLIIGPSKLRSAYNQRIGRQQMRTNSIGTGLEIPSSSSNVIEKLINRFSGNNRGQPRRGFITKARTVESPALSVDSGGLASSSLAQEMAKLLEIKQGYYADVYNNLDKRPNYPTKRPADAIEDAMRASVVQIFNDQHQSSSG